MAAQAAAFKLAQFYGISQPGHVCLEDIAMDCGAFVTSGTVDGCEARLVRKKNRGIIRVSRKIREIGRRRFAIAHELGHWKLHTVTQFFVCLASDLRDYKTNPVETEANTFASELLMPTYLVRERCEKTEPLLAVISDIAEEFRVSLTAAAIRFVMLNNHETMLVASQSGSVKWWFTKNARFGLWFRSKQAIDPHTLAGCVYSGEDVSGAMERVPAELWFPEYKRPDSLEVVEQTAFSRIYNSALTLLTLGDADI